MPTVRQPKTEDQWQAEDDFRTLTQAEEVMVDTKRLNKAKKAGKALVAKEKKALARKEKVAGSRGRAKKRSR